MSEKYGDDLFTISDDEGHEFVLEHVDSLEINGAYYLAFLPTDVEPDDEKYGLIILKAVSPDVNADLVVPTDEELDIAFHAFMERLFEDEEEANGLEQ